MKNWTEKKSFDLSSALDLEIEEKSRTLRMSQSELIRRSVQDFISSFGDCINFEIQLLNHDIRREYELIERHEKEIEFHKLKIKHYQKQLVEKQKLINSNNPAYVDDELKIKTILLERFATNNYPKNTPHDAIIEQLKVISNNRNADIHVVLKITEMLFENKITLRDIIERPLQNIIEEKEIASRDSESFKAVKKQLWNKYGKFILQQEQIQKEIDEEKRIHIQPENDRLKYVIKQVYNQNYRSKEVMQGSVKMKCKQFNLDSEKTLNIINQIYSNKIKYEKVLESNNIFNMYCTLALPPLDSISDNQKDVESSKIFENKSLKDMILQMSQIPFDKIKNINLLKVKIKKYCIRQNIEFKEVWNFIENKYSTNNLI